MALDNVRLINGTKITKKSNKCTLSSIIYYKEIVN